MAVTSQHCFNPSRLFSLLFESNSRSLTHLYVERALPNISLLSPLYSFGRAGLAPQSPTLLYTLDTSIPSTSLLLHSFLVISSLPSFHLHPTLILLLPSSSRPRSCSEAQSLLLGWQAPTLGINLTI